MKREITFSEDEVVEMLSAAAHVCKTYFEIAEEELGEKELRKRFKKRFSKTIKEFNKRKK